MKNNRSSKWKRMFFGLLICLMSMIFAFGQTPDEDKLELVVQTGHTGKISSVALSPDGRFLISSSMGIIKWWDVASGKEIKTINTGGFYGVLSPDGKTIALPRRDKTVKLWDLASGKELMTLSGHSKAVSSVVFSPDGKTLASESIDSNIKLWDVESGKELRTLSGHAGVVFSVAFSPDGKTLASASFDKTIKLWDTASGKELRTLSGYTGLDDSVVAFSPDGKTLASGSIDSNIKLWDVESGKEIRTLSGHTGLVYSVAFSPDGKTLASGDTDSTIRLWDVASGKEIRTLSGHAGWVYSFAFSPDGKTLASGSRDKSIKLWDIASGKEIRTFLGYAKEIWSGAISPDGKTIASGSSDKTIKLWDIASGKELRTLSGHTGLIFSVAFSPDGKTIASGSSDKTIKLWDIASGKELRTLSGHANRVSRVAFSSDGKILASGSRDSTIKLWDIASGKELESFSTDNPNTTAKVRSVVPGFYKDSIPANHRFQIKSVANGKLNLHDVKTGKLLASLIALDENDWAMVAPDGRFDASEGAQTLMHYTYGREIIELEQLKDEYYEPGLLQKLLGYNKEALRPIVPLKDVKLYPEILEQNYDAGSKQLTIKLKVRSGGIGETGVFVNGKLAVADARSVELKENPDVPFGEIVTLTADMSGTSFKKGAENEIKVITSNYLKEIGKSNIKSRGLVRVYKDARRKDISLPSLYAIVGGVSDYDGDRIDLRFAAKDAEDFSNALSLGARRLFCDKDKPDCLDKVNITTLSTSGNEGTIQPTKENFKKAFADIARKAKPDDIVIIYVAGHGVSLGGDRYFFLTKEARSLEDLEKRFQTVAISSEELTEWLTQTEWVKGEKGIKSLSQVLILDTCAAGTAAAQLALTAKRDLSSDQIRAIEFLKDKTGTFILMGSTADAVSYEASKFGQGLLTRSLLEAMAGAELDKGEYIDVRKLFAYAEKKVPELATDIGGVQKPIVKTGLGNTFVIGQMTEAEKRQIKLSSPKPYIARPSLIKLITLTDPLRLTPKLITRFKEESSFEFVRRRDGRKKTSLVYLDDSDFPDAYRISGTYEEEGNKVRIKAKLIKNEEVVSELPEIVGGEETVIDKLMEVIQQELTKFSVN